MSMWEGLKFGSTARQECQLESDPESLYLSSLINNNRDHNSINNYHHQSVGVSLCLLYIYKMLDK